jgi:SAM-dependent methyltransferase
MTPKRYDRRYFDRWYRDPSRRVKGPAEVARKAALAVAAAEQVLGRPLRSVLDVGAGEGRWQPVLQRLRPGSRYAGLDSSEYAVRRYGRRRNLRLSAFGDVAESGVEGPYDLVVCSDVLHYLPAAELTRGVAAFPALIGGIAFLDLLTSADGVEGDLHGFLRRSAAWYRDRFRGAGLVPLGLHCWTTAAIARELPALEQPLPHSP